MPSWQGVATWRAGGRIGLQASHANHVPGRWGSTVEGLAPPLAFARAPGKQCCAIDHEHALHSWLTREGGRFLTHEEALPVLGEDALGGADEVGVPCVLRGEADDDAGGVGEGDPLGHGGPTDQRRPLKAEEEQHPAEEPLDAGAFAQLLARLSTSAKSDPESGAKPDPPRACLRGRHAALVRRPSRGGLRHRRRPGGGIGARGLLLFVSLLEESYLCRDVCRAG